MDLHELKVRFTYHRPTEKLHNLMDRIRVKGFRFAEVLITMLPESRERSIAVRKIEEAVFWAQAALTRQEADRD